jgi:transcriptional regulator with XRE-family HTH domain
MHGNLNNTEIKELQESVRKQLGVKILETREKKGLTQVDLASRVEGSFDTSNVSRIESGRINTTVFTLIRIARALEVPVADLLDFNLPEH